jgi:hypothetical protein
MSHEANEAPSTPRHRRPFAKSSALVQAAHTIGHEFCRCKTYTPMAILERGFLTSS